ncbi:hypothetical protein [Reyranella soli]|uniref:hypothetical protein n=1 Tax=Reyranella soli TaxID=1230389 RepID=UPI0011BF5699|nr:hypothetical protein [Reyranella soli]
MEFRVGSYGYQKLFNARELALAQGIIFRMLRADRWSVSSLIEDLPPITDIELNIAQFLRDVEVLMELRIGVPVLLERTPVSLSYLLGMDERKNKPRDGSVLLQVVERQPPLSIFSFVEAKEMLVEQAGEFLAMRMAADRMRRDRTFDSARTDWEHAEVEHVFKNERTLISTPGCRVGVHTQTSNLKVHWSGAYFLTQELLWRANITCFEGSPIRYLPVWGRWGQLPRGSLGYVTGGLPRCAPN